MTGTWNPSAIVLALILAIDGLDGPHLTTTCLHLSIWLSGKSSGGPLEIFS